MSSNREEEREEEKELEIEEIKAVGEYLLPKVTEILEKIRESLKEVIETIMSSIDGKKLAQDISELYTGLKQAGLPEEMIKEIVRDFYRKKLEITPSLDTLLRNVVQSVFRGREEKREEEGE